jgi:hypothetical protein
LRFRLQSGTTTCQLTGTGVSNVYDKSFDYTTSGGSQATDNTVAVTSPGGSYSWLIEFTGGGNVDGSSSCHEVTTITINNAANP